MNSGLFNYTRRDKALPCLILKLFNYIRTDKALPCLSFIDLGAKDEIL